MTRKQKRKIAYIIRNILVALSLVAVPIVCLILLFLRHFAAFGWLFVGDIYLFVFCLFFSFYLMGGRE